MKKYQKTRHEKAQKLVDDFYNNKYGLTSEQLKIAIEFDKERQANDLSIVSRANILQIIYRLCMEIKTPFEKVTKTQLRDYLNKRQETLAPNSMKLIKTYIKLFFNYIHNCKPGSNAEVIDWIQIKSRERHKKLEKIIISEKEYKKLLQGCLTQRDRAITAFLYNTGARIGEVIEVNIEHLTFDKLGRYVKVKLSGKTGEREIVLTSGIAEIEGYLKQHPFNEKKDSALFLTLPKSNQPNRRIGWEGISNMLNDLGNRAIKRHINPHLFRHSFATKLASKLTDVEMRIAMGWNKNSTMPGKYAHLRDKEVNEKLLIEAGLIKESVKKQREEAYKDISCPRCNTQNSFDSKMCRQCFFSFTEEGIEKVAIADKVLQKTGVLGVNKDILKEAIKEMIKNGEIKL